VEGKGEGVVGVGEGDGGEGFELGRQRSNVGNSHTANIIINNNT
jgi:hypothetical protein